MSDLDFLFVWPAAINGFARHLGTAHIQAYLKIRGVQAGQFLHPGNVSLDQLTARMLERRPRIIGFSCYDLDYPRVRLLAARIRGASPGTVIVCGGPAATFSDRVILDDCPAIDCCVRYEGESAALELLEWMDGKRPLPSIRGITYRSGQAVLRTPDRELAGLAPGSLDEFPDPYLEGVIPAAEANPVGLVTSRGCTFSCTYCNFRAVSRGRIRYHSVERVISVLSYLDRELAGAGTKTEIPIHDDNLSLDRDRFHRLLGRMAELGFQNLSFNGMMRPDLLAEESFPLLRAAGFAWLQFGVESGAPRVLGAVKRVRLGGGEKDGYRLEKDHLERVAWAVDRTRRAGLGAVSTVILGCPGETEEQGRETVEFIRRLNVDSYSHGFLKVHAGTELEHTCGEFGIRRERLRLTPLPRRTRLAYPAHRIPMLDHALPFPARTNAKMALILRLLTGTTETYSDAVPRSGIGACGPVLGLSPLAPASAVHDWFSAQLPYTAVACLMLDGPTPPDDLPGPDWAGAPFEVCTLRAVPHEAGGCLWRLNEVAVDAPPQNCMAIRALPLAAVDWNDLAGLADPARQTLLLTADAAGDVQALESLCATGERAGSWKLPLAALESCLSIADSCRWAGTPCPAAEGIRWFVGDTGGLSPCGSSARMGEVGQSPALLREALQCVERTEAEKRDCAACPVANSCSRCLFPGELGAAGFCGFRRRHPELPALLDGLVLARLLVQANMVPEGATGFSIHSLRDRLQGESARAGGPVPLSECLLLTLDGTSAGYLCHSRRKLLVSVGGQQLRTFQALIGPQLSVDSPRSSESGRTI
jgi:radical SAM superfamily enzyme YgiQ (UPF0313 family)